MSDQLDRILGILDVGLQSSSEWGFGTDCSPDHCSRCRSEAPMDNGDLCGGCRSFLLGDSDRDPAENPDVIVRRWVDALSPRPRPIDIDQSEGLLCVGGPLDGRLYVHDGYYMRALIPPPPSAWMAEDASPTAPSIETVTYERRKVGWRNGEQVWFGSCWLVSGDDGQIVIDTLNAIAGMARFGARLSSETTT